VKYIAEVLAEQVQPGHEWRPIVGREPAVAG